MQKAGNFFDNLTGCLSNFAIVFIFLVVGAGLSWWGWTILQNARASADWPSVEGQITSAEMDLSSDPDGGYNYSPQVAYSYLVNDQFYESYQIKFGENSYSSQKEAEGILSRYPVEQTVVVFYDPANPNKAILEPGVSGGSYIVFGVGALFVLIALLFPLILGIRLLFGRRG